MKERTGEPVFLAALRFTIPSFKEEKKFWHPSEETDTRTFVHFHFKDLEII